MLAIKAIEVFSLLALAIGSSYGEGILLEGLAFTSWGEWGELVLCDLGSYVYGMRLKVEFDQGTFSDDSALNAIDLLCTSPTAKRPASNSSIQEFQVITSSEGHKGIHGIILECPAPFFAVAYQLRSEPNQLADDTAGNNLRLFCSDAVTILEGYGMDWGDWTPPLQCPRGLRICGLQTQIEGPTGDDTTLNNVNMLCCP